VDEQAAFAQFRQRDGGIGNSQPYELAAFGVMVGKAEGDVIDRFLGAIGRTGAAGDQVHDWCIAGIEPVAWKQKVGPIAKLKVQHVFHKGTRAFRSCVRKVT
jgi:hypothetical protein